MKGRNKFKKRCYKCGEWVYPNEGYLKDRGKDVLERWAVSHIEDCKPDFDEKAPLPPAKVTKEFAIVELGDQEKILPMLEETLKKRQLNNEPVSTLPAIIQYIKSLQAKIKILESTIEKR